MAGPACSPTPGHRIRSRNLVSFLSARRVVSRQLPPLRHAAGVLVRARTPIVVRIMEGSVRRAAGSLRCGVHCRSRPHVRRTFAQVISGTLFVLLMSEVLRFCVESVALLPEKLAAAAILALTFGTIRTILCTSQSHCAQWLFEM